MYRRSFHRNTSTVVSAFFLWIVLAILIWAPVLWTDFSPNIMNDGDTPLYTSYAINLLSCPLSTTFGLMTDAVGLNCLPVMSEMPFTYYRDHPPGMAWLLAMFVSHSPTPFLVARIIECLISAGTLALCALIAARAVSTAAAVGVLIASAFTPVFWFHAVSINLNQAALLFSVATVGTLLEYDRSHNRYWMLLSLCAFVLGGLIDWPVFFVAGPIGIWLLLNKRWSVFTAYLLVGLATLLGILIYFASIPVPGSSAFTVLHFFQSSLISPLDARNGAHLIPVATALKQSLVYAINVLSYGSVLLLVPFLALATPSFRSKYKNTFLFFACFLTQGTLNQVLFHQWSGTHNYWSYYYLAAIFMGGGVLFDMLWSWKQEIRYRFVLLAIVTVISLLSVYSMRQWWSTYRIPPQSTSDYLRENHLENLLAPDAVLLAESVAPFFHQGFKLRLEFQKSLQSIEKATDYGCQNVFTIFKASSLKPEARKMLPEGRELERFDWYVIPKNYKNPACN